MPEPETIQLRVYYEDTDMAGIVYYANYLKFIERGRSEFLRTHNVDQSALRDDQNMVFVVTELHAHYHKPAKFDDLLTVSTVITEIKRASLAMSQQVYRDDLKLFSADVSLALLNAAGRPLRIPAWLAERLANSLP